MGILLNATFYFSFRLLLINIRSVKNPVPLSLLWHPEGKPREFITWGHCLGQSSHTRGHLSKSASSVLLILVLPVAECLCAAFWGCVVCSVGPSDTGHEMYRDLYRSVITDTQQLLIFALQSYLWKSHLSLKMQYLLSAMVIVYWNSTIL